MCGIALPVALILQDGMVLFADTTWHKNGSVLSEAVHI